VPENPIPDESHEPQKSKGVSVMRSFRFKLQPLLLVLSLTACAAVAFGQLKAPAPAPAPTKPDTTDWETLSPEGEEFSVLMPKGSTSQSSKEPYHKMELNTRMYISGGATGPVFAVVSLSGIKSNPALYTEMQRINSYVDAFKTLFPPKVRKEPIVKLALVGNKTLMGNAGREYRMSIGDLSGTAQVFATRKRFYSIVYLNTKKEDGLQEHFLSSFTLPEKSGDVAPTTTAATAAPEPTATAQEAQLSKKPADEANNAANMVEEPPKQGGEEKPAAGATGEKPGDKHGPISAGVLNGKALSLPRPDYPADARSAGVDGVVVIQVTVDEQGNVTEARAVSGPKILQEPSVNAAFQAKFSPTLVEGAAVKVTGVIVYNFGRPMS
jgi:TonB family protein